jgi:hypothetical protein
MELDRLLPTYDFRSRYTRRIAADPATVWAALVSLTAEELPLSRFLMSVRSAGSSRSRGPIMQSFGPPPLVRVEGTELVKGAVAKFWRPRPTPAPIPPGDPDAFAAFTEPGWAKAAMGMLVAPHDGGTLIAVETRVKATDAAARRAFAAYWLLIRVGGAGFIRLELLRALARRAERDAASAAEQPRP